MWDIEVDSSSSSTSLQDYCASVTAVSSTPFYIFARSICPLACMVELVICVPFLLCLFVQVYIKEYCFLFNFGLVISRALPGTDLLPTNRLWAQSAINITKISSHENLTSVVRCRFVVVVKKKKTRHEPERISANRSVVKRQLWYLEDPDAGNAR